MKYFTNIVKLYSVAFFEHGVKNKIIHKLWEEFSVLKTLFASDSSVMNIISAPIYSEDEQKQLLKAVFSKISLTDDMANFIYVLAHNKRLALFPLILEYFHILMNMHDGKKNVEITLSNKVSAGEQEQILKQLERAFSSKIDASFKEDQKILAGMIIKTDNKMFDASLRTKFTDLTDSVNKKIALL